MLAQLYEPLTHLPRQPVLPFPSHSSAQNATFQKLDRTSQPASISLPSNEIHLSLAGKPVNSSTYASFLDSCKCPELGKQVHAHALKTGFCGHGFVDTKLLQMYARCGCLEDAYKLFDAMSNRNLYSWVAIISSHVDYGIFEEALLLFQKLRLGDMELEFFVFPLVLKACGGLGSIELGRQIHGMVTKFGFISNIYVGNSLIDMYGKCDCLNDANRVLALMPERDCVSWNSIVTACASNGMVYEAMEILDKMSYLDNLQPNLISWSAVIGGFAQNGYDEEAIDVLSRMVAAGIEPNARTLASVLPACARTQKLNVGKEIHGHVTRHELMFNSFVVNGLVDLYRRCADLKSAFKIFSKFSLRNAVSFNTMIVGYCEIGDISKARDLFDQMELVGVKKDIISWNSMISGYVNNGLAYEALNIFQHLVKIDGVKPDSFTLGSVLNICADIDLLRLGKEFHSYAISRGLQSNPFVGGALVEMYSKCQDLNAAQKAFDEVIEPDTPTWNALISGYAHCNQISLIEKLLGKMKENGFEPTVYTWNGIIAGCMENDRHESALQFFSEMQRINIKPDMYTVGIVLTCCSKLSTAERGKQCHAYSIRHGYESVHVGAALVDMYAKCGSIKLAQLAYERIWHHNLVSHNAMLTAYAMHGYGMEGIDLFRRLLSDGVSPDHVTFLAVLSACVHAGSVETGYEFFDLMGFYSVKPTLKHFTCMVDLLSRAGMLNEAYELIKKLPMNPDSIIWGALLGGCVVHGNVELGEIAAEGLILLEPNNTGNYIMLANLYAFAGRWSDLARTRQMIKDRGLHKGPGCSWIEDKGDVHVFVACDRTHKKTYDIYSTLDILTIHMKLIP